MSEHQALLKSLVSTVRSASVVASQDVNFYKSLDKDVEKQADDCSNELLNLANSLLQTVAPREMEDLVTMEDLDENWKSVGNILDTLFEKTDISLDQLRNASKKTNAITSTPDTATNADDTKLQSVQAENDESYTEYIKSQYAAKTLSKPQLKFSRKVDNSGNKPFKPLLTSKPHALISLEQSLKTQEFTDDEGIIHQRYTNPYATEIEKHKFGSDVVTKKHEPIPFKDWYKTEAIYVDNKQKLNEMLGELQKSKEIAVDLEHHDLRSYYGFVCLMQISNREQDWIVDTLVLREELQVLNHVFTDPNIVKVFHGAHMDIIWLQRDFGLYIVGLFDTYYGAKALGLKRHGLAFLLETYAKFYQSKKYQLADWRVRPLPEPMIKYARADTHFLLYVYDIMRNQLIDNKLLEGVLNDSKKVALQTYETPGYLSTSNPSAYDKLVVKYKMNPSQEVVLRQLYNWRDQVARDLDESPRYVMPNYYMIALSSQMPTDVPSVLGAATTGVTPHVRTAAKEIATIIANAKKLIKDLDLTAEIDVTTLDNCGDGDDYGVDFYLISSNYDRYMKGYSLALKQQSSLFDSKSILKGTKKLIKAKSDFFGQTILLKPVIDTEDLRIRSDHVREHLMKLQGNVIYEDTGSSSSEGESEGDSDDSEQEQEHEHTNENEEDVPTQNPSAQNGADDPNQNDEKEEDVLLLPEAHEDDLAFLNAKQRRKAKRKQMSLIKKTDKKRKLELKEQLGKQFDEFDKQTPQPVDKPNNPPNPVSQPSGGNAMSTVDYSKAESVLNPPSEDPRAQKLKNNKQDKGFTNSFQDNIKGARKVPKNREINGSRTMVFKTKTKKVKRKTNVKQKARAKNKN